MAKFTVEETISDGSNAAQIWARLRQYAIDGKTVELVKRTVGGAMVIEVRRWKGIRNDDSNRASASPDVDY
jgi:hypothetical protein